MVLFAGVHLPFATCMIKLQELYYLYPFKLSRYFLYSKILDSNLFPHIKGKKISIVCKHSVCMYVWEVFCNVDAAVALWATARKTRIMSWRCPLSDSPRGIPFLILLGTYLYSSPLENDFCFLEWCLRFISIADGKF